MASRVEKISQPQSKTVVVCSIGNASFFSQRFFEQISSSVNRVGSGEDLIRELATTRPIGVFLVVSDTDLLDSESWMRTLEQKILFEGMRVVLALKHDGSNPARVFGSKNFGKFHLTQCFGVRDLLLYDESTTDADMNAMIERVKFAFGVITESPFSDSFRLLAECQERWEISVPGRISVLEDDRHLVVESAVFVHPGAQIKVRFMALGSNFSDVPATVIENLPSGLRFNFGNSLRVRISEESWSAVQRLVTTEHPSKVFRKPVRRAMVVTRNVPLRQRIVAHLANSQIEARIPLVRRNIKGDLPPLSPDFVIVEAAALASTNAAEGAREIEEYLALAGPQCHVIVVGRRADWNPSLHPRVTSVRESENIEDDLSSVLELTRPAARTRDGLKSVWFATSSQCSKVMLVLVDRSVSVGSSGLVVETAHAFRMWSNVEVRSLESKAHFIGRIARVFRNEDAFRSMLRLGYKESPVFAVQIASIAANQSLEQLYSAAVAKVTPAGNAPVPPAAARNLRDLSVRADNAEEYGRAEALARTRRGSHQPSRSMLGIGALVAVVVLIVAIAIWFGQGDQSVYGESFRKLFELSGKRSSEP